MKLVAIDLDGTLLNSQHEISDADKTALNKLSERKIEVVIATGRSVLSGKAIFRYLGINGYLIALNGSYLTKVVAGEEIGAAQKSFVENRQVKKAFELSMEAEVTFIANSEKRSDRVVRQDIDQLVQEFQTQRKDLVNISVEAMRSKLDKNMDSYLKVAFTDKNVERLKNLRKELHDQGIKTIFSDEFYIELLPENVNKGTALKKLCEKLGISMAEVVAIGDQENDLEMLKNSGIGIAMGNAEPQVKRAAVYETATNDQSGVAQALAKFF